LTTTFVRPVNKERCATAHKLTSDETAISPARLPPLMRPHTANEDNAACEDVTCEEAAIASEAATAAEDAIAD
jgi:hypothetical protein